MVPTARIPVVPPRPGVKSDLSALPLDTVVSARNRPLKRKQASLPGSLIPAFGQTCNIGIEVVSYPFRSRASAWTTTVSMATAQDIESLIRMVLWRSKAFSSWISDTRVVVIRGLDVGLHHTH